MTSRNDAENAVAILGGLALIAAMFAAIGSQGIAICLLLIAGIGVPMGLMLRIALGQVSQQQTDGAAAVHEHQNSKT
ncbi:hypothetical protein [Paucibacter soli]|uniref:hypothetical protein n=1 Tax=Paucibacter soli TaxID=3133433 RepID=UPI0030A9E968